MKKLKLRLMILGWLTITASAHAFETLNQICTERLNFNSSKYEDAFKRKLGINEAADIAFATGFDEQKYNTLLADGVAEPVARHLARIFTYRNITPECVHYREQMIEKLKEKSRNRDQ